MGESRRKPRRAPRAAEPVQVYLDPPDRERLERLARRLDTTKSEVLRRGLAALESLGRSRPEQGRPVPLPSYRGDGLQPGVNLDDSAGLLRLMDEDDAAV